MRKLIPVIFLLFINLSGFTVLIFRELGLGFIEQAVYSTIFILIATYLIKDLKLKQREVLILTTALIFLIIQFIRGILSGESISKSFLSLSEYVLLISIVLNFSKKSLFEVHYLVFTVFKFSICSAIIFDFINFLITRNSIGIVLQNELIFILLTSMYFISHSKSEKNKVRTYYLLIIYIIWIFISNKLSSDSLRIQFKSIILGLILIASYLFLMFRKINLRKKLKKSGLQITIAYFLSIFLISGFLIYDKIIPYIPRAGSGMVRIGVFEVMIKTTLYNNALLGSGLGTSQTLFDIRNFLNQNFDSKWFYVKSHSGLASLFFEQGLAFVFLFYIFFNLLFFLNKNQKTKCQIHPINKLKSYNLLLLASIIWVLHNTVYAGAIVGTFPAHMGQLILFVGILILTIKELNYETSFEE